VIAFGICLLAAAGVSRPGSEAITELDEIRLAWPSPECVRSSTRSSERRERYITRRANSPAPQANSSQWRFSGDAGETEEVRSIACYTAGG
jgi:hypothetical protein